MKFQIEAQARDATGRAANRELRMAGRVPAVVYGGGQDPSAVSLDHNSLIRQMDQEAFYTSILTLSVGKDAHSVVVKDVQRHPARQDVIHLDFQRIVEDEEITLHVPIHLVGEEKAIGVKEQGGQIEQSMTDIEISCLPRHLPEFIAVDVSGLGLNEILHLSDVAFPEGVESVALSHGQDNAVVSIHPPRREEVEEVEGEEEAVVEGEAPAAEEAAAAEPAAED